MSAMPNRFRYYPSNMLYDYKNMDFYVGGEQVSIAVNNYRNNNEASNPTGDKGGTQDALVVKDGLLSCAGGAIKRLGVQSYMDVFTGKGSPSNIKSVLKIFYDYGDQFIEKYKKDKGTACGKVATWMDDHTVSWQDALQNISNDFIGLDCNGFIGNWLAIADPSLKIGPNSTPRVVYNAKKIQRKSVNDIERGDVVVWVNFSHIAAITDIVEINGNKKFKVCQSAGGGPRMNEYKINSVNNGMFNLIRSDSSEDAKGDVGGAVYIISLWNS